MVPSPLVVTPKNARGRPVTKLCLALETFRRTDDGRARDAKAFLGHFFPQDKDGAKDRLFVHIPKEVRADLLSNWGIRGKKSALRDDDDKVRTTVADALGAGDIDANVIEEGVTPDILIDWVPLEEWWSFWRGTALPVASVRKALALARDLSLFDERWFLEHLKLTSQRLEGTDVICAGLSKEQLAGWIQAIHKTGDASPTGMIAALGWETVLAKTANEALTFALDALARQIGLVDDPSQRRSDAPPAISERPKATAGAAKAEHSKPPEPPRSEKPAPPAAKPATSSKPPPLPPPPPPKPAAAAPGVVSPIQVVAPAQPPASPGPATARGMVMHDPMPMMTAPAPPPVSAPPVSIPNARELFGVPADLPPMRPPAATLSGVGAPPLFESTSAEVAVPSFQIPGEEPTWAPPRAEPGDMGWDLVYGVKRPMSNNVQPRYNFDDDDEPTSEIALPGDSRRPRA